MIGVDTHALMHPARIRILTALADREATPQEIAASLPDVPKASLYRHLNILRAIGAIREVRQYKVRGAYETVYALETESGPLSGLSHTGARLSEWLNRMIVARSDDEAGTPASALRSNWRRTARLTPDQASDLCRAVEKWMNKNATMTEEENASDYVIVVAADKAS